MEDDAPPQIFPASPADIGIDDDMGAAEILAQLAIGFPECFNLDALHELPDEDELKKYQKVLDAVQHVETHTGMDSDLNFIDPASMRLHIMRHLLDFGLCACSVTESMGDEWPKIVDELKVMGCRIILNPGQSMPNYGLSSSDADANRAPSWNLFVEKDDSSVQKFVSGASKAMHTGELGGMFKMGGLMPANKY
jgi:hypothetical protein